MRKITLRPIIEYMKQKRHKDFYEWVLMGREREYYDPRYDPIYRKLLVIYEDEGNSDFWSLVRTVGEHRGKISKAYLEKVHDLFMRTTEGKFADLVEDHALCDTVVKEYLYILHAYLDMAGNLTPGEPLDAFCHYWNKATIVQEINNEDPQ